MVKRNKKLAATPYDKRPESIQTTLSALRQDLDLWYKIQVLLYDLSKVARDPQSEKRISSTTHPLYISEPYFSVSESTRILTAVIDDSANVEAIRPQYPNSDYEEPHTPEGKTIEEAIYDTMTNFLDKRKASGDARPCGPHDMVPVYGSIFGIPKEKLEDERFLARLKRSGLGDLRLKDKDAVKGRTEENCTKGQKKG